MFEPLSAAPPAVWRPPASAVYFHVKQVVHKLKLSRLIQMQLSNNPVSLSESAQWRQMHLLQHLTAEMSSFIKARCAHEVLKRKPVGKQK